MTDTAGGRPADQRSVAQLITDATNQVSTLVRDEIRLAILELQQKGKRIGVGAGLLGGAGLVAMYGMGAIVAGVILLLATVMAAWLAAFIVGGAVLFIAAVMALFGRGQARRAAPPIPKRAVESVKQDIAVVKEGARR
jgi:Putative Actinobacterial Holin-X, holin superfamily III